MHDHREGTMIIDLTMSDDEDDDHGAQGHSAYVRLTRSDRDENNEENGAFFFGGIMRSRACAVCRTQTFMFGPDRRPTCNTCFGRTHGAVVLPSRTHGYGVFALHAARGADVTWICDAVPLGSSSPSSPSSPLTTTATATTVPVFPEPHITEAFATVEAFETRVATRVEAFATVGSAETVATVGSVEAAEAVRPVFTEGQTVMYMGGELFSEKEHGALFGECGTPFAVSAGDGQVLDATLYRNPACYINSVLPDSFGAFGAYGRGASDRGAFGRGAEGPPASSPASPTSPNMKMWYETDTGNVSITALRDIYDGEELFLDYGPGYAWDIGCTVSVTPSRDRDRGTKRPERAERPDGHDRPDRPERADWEDWTGGPERSDIADRPIVKRARTASGETRIIVALE
jgi:hypothetical protein